jgi:hypothetical protein
MKPSGMPPAFFFCGVGLQLYIRRARDQTRSGRHRGVFRNENAYAEARAAGDVAGGQPGCRRQILCGAFLMCGTTIGGVTVGLMVGLSCRSGSIEVIWLQALHL